MSLMERDIAAKLRHCRRPSNGSSFHFTTILRQAPLQQACEKQPFFLVALTRRLAESTPQFALSTTAVFPLLTTAGTVIQSAKPSPQSAPLKKEKRLPSPTTKAVRLARDVPFLKNAIRFQLQLQSLHPSPNAPQSLQY